MKKPIELILEKKIVVFLILILVSLGGIIAYRNLKIDVFPDPSPVVVQIFAEPEGLAPEEVEKFISYPIETSMFGIPGVKKITSLSTFGMSTVSIYFDDNTDIYFARQLVGQKLSAIKDELPPMHHPPEMGPISTGLGMVYVYTLKGDSPVMELRTLQDWVIKLQLQTVPGVASVLSHGGDIKQFHVEIDPLKLIKYKIDLHTVIEQIQHSSLNTTAGFIVKNNEEYTIRGIGLLEDLQGLKKVMIKESAASPIFLENIARVRVGAAIKRGEVVLNNEGTAVSGIVMKLIGVNTAELINELDNKIAEINRGLPDNVKIVPVYNQALIIKAAFSTVSEALIIGIILVAIILFLFINNLTSALVSALSIPFSVFCTFIIMKITNMTADLMSFGGLAIGIGLLVDATVVVVENISRYLEESKGSVDKKALILKSVRQVLRPLSYAMIMIIFSFLPILTLVGVEGKMFKPFGIALLTAIISAIMYAIFIAPALMNSFKIKKTVSTAFIFDSLKKIYLKIFDFFYRKENLTIVLFVIIFLVSIVLLFNTGSEFIPTLNEQTLQLQFILPQNATIDESIKVMKIINGIVLQFQDVENVIGRIGRGEAGSHSHTVNMGNAVITLKKKSQRKIKQEEDLIAKISTEVKKNVPGILLNFTQPIKHNLDHLLTGVRADLAIKVYGDDYTKLINIAERVEAILHNIEGVADIQVSRISGQHEIAVKLNRENLARYSLTPEEVLEDIEAAFGGQTIARLYQGDVAYDIFIRYQPHFRKDINDLKNYLIQTGKGQLIPLQTVASIQEESGYANISRENGKRYITIQGNARSRDIGSIVKDSQKEIYQQIQLPMGYFFDWGGQFELKERAENRLYLVLLATLILIMILLFDFLKCWKDIFIILINLPVSLSGGIISLALAGAYLSVPSTIGFIALLGIALENTLILITFLKRMTFESKDFDAAVRNSVSQRLRPILMTKFTTIIGLFPLLFSIGIGSEIQKPLVIVVIGGIFFSIFTTLLLMPVVYKKIYKDTNVCD